MAAKKPSPVKDDAPVSTAARDAALAAKIRAGLTPAQAEQVLQAQEARDAQHKA